MIDIDLIRIDGGTQARAELNQETVAEYAEAFKAGAEFPPVVLFFDGSSHWLVDGYHRYFAAKAAGLKTIYEKVTPGTQRDAILFSLSANATHGLRRTNADKRKAVQTLLDDPEWSSWSDREIARQCGVTHPFVSSLRNPKVVTVTTKVKEEKPDQVVTVTTPDKKEKAFTPVVETFPPLEVPDEPSQVNQSPVEPEPQEEYTELDALRDQVEFLLSEVARLKLMVPAEAESAGDIVADMQRELKTMRETNKVLTQARDRLQNENAELKRQCAFLQKKIKG